MSVEWGRKQERLTAEHFPGLFSNSNLGRGCARGPKQNKIDCFVLGRVAAFQFHGYSLCPFWSPISVFLCKAVSFSMIESILRLIVSVSMQTALPTASIITGSLVFGRLLPFSKLKKFVHRGGPPAGSGNGTGNKSSVRERGHIICTSLQQGNRVLQPVFHSSKKRWKVASLMAHQPSGDVGCISCSQEFPSRSQGPPCACLLRQHISGLLRQHIGGLLPQVPKWSRPSAAR